MHRALAAAMGLVLSPVAYPESFAVVRPSGTALREEIVAVVRGPGVPEPRVLTLTRLEEEARIALVSAGGTVAAAAPLDGAALRAALDWLVDQTLLGDEVARLQILELDASDSDAALRRFRERFARPADYSGFLARLELSEEELAQVLFRTLRVERYVESRTATADSAVGAGRVKALLADLRARSEIRILDRFEEAPR